MCHQLYLGSDQEEAVGVCPFPKQKRSWYRPLVWEQNTVQLLHLVSSSTGQIWARGSPIPPLIVGTPGTGVTLQPFPLGWECNLGHRGCLNASACLVGSDVNSVDFVDSGSAMRKTVARQNAKLEGGSSKPDFVVWEIEVPKELVGRLIGKQGRFMSYLRQASGAKIYVSTLPYFRDSQVCHIEGTSHQVEKVLSLIGKKFKELCLTNIYTIPPPMPLPLHSLLVSAWLFLPDGVTVEVVVAHQVDAGHMFLQQHTHPTFHVLRSLDQQMFACYSQPEIPTLPTPVEVGIICAAPGLDGAWLRAQVISYFEETDEVELKYVDYGGYDKVKVDTLRQIRSDFLTLPFQGAEVLLDNVVPLPDEDRFSPEADAAVSEMTRGAVLVAQVTNYDSVTGLPLIQLWNLMGDEVVSINRTLVERGFARWLDY